MRNEIEKNCNKINNNKKNRDQIRHKYKLE